jgi:hypothetical protein
MGFDAHLDLWALLVAGCWTLRRQSGVFEPPLADIAKQLQRLRNESPIAVAVSTPDRLLLDAFEDLQQFRKHQKRAAILARHGRHPDSPEPPWLVGIVSATVVDETTVAPLASHSSFCQVWQYSDRGVGLNIGGSGARRHIETSAATHGIEIEVVARVPDVPTW